MLRSPYERVVDGRFLIEPFEAAYGGLEAEDWAARVAGALEELEDCRVCPRDCGVNRLAGEEGTCRTGRHAWAASAFAHFRGGGWPPGAARIGHDLLQPVQPALCLLPELGHQPAARGQGDDAGDAGGLHAGTAGRGLSQHQLRDAGACGAAGDRRAGGGRGAGLASADCLQHERLRRARLAAGAGRVGGTFTCRTSSSGTRRRRETWRRPGTTRSARGKRSSRCIVRWACCDSGRTALRGAACWCGTW